MMPIISKWPNLACLADVIFD